MEQRYDVVVVGSGPNGLAAAIVAAQRGLSVAVFEANDTLGGGTRSAELTRPRFIHDLCSAVHPMAIASPLFRTLPLADHGLRWITPAAAYAHPLDDGSAGIVFNSIDETIVRLGTDGPAYRASIGAILDVWSDIEADLLGPIGAPTHPLSFAKFGIKALMPAAQYARWRFSSRTARALFAGAAAHSMIPLDQMASASFGLVLATVAHAHGWPIPQGGSQAIANALVSYLQSLGGTCFTGHPITRFGELPESRIVLFDTSPRMLAQIAGDRIPPAVKRALFKFRYGPGVYKVDWALDGPIPWTAPECLQASTVHVGGTLEEIVYAERAPWRDACADRPFVLVTQPSVFDPTRAPKGQHTAWGYCHVPAGSTKNMTGPIEAQIERFAPGFRDRILARAVRGPRDFERDNANLIGGDIGGGANTVLQIFFRPTRHRYTTGRTGLYLCSASTPPGGGVHGMCGYHAAIKAIAEVFGSENKTNSNSSTSEYNSL